MRVNRTFLYAGVFLLAIGGVLVATDLRVVDAALLSDVLRLWPFALLAIGASLVLRRSQFSLPTGMLAAAVPGLVLGGALAIGPKFIGECGARGEPANVVSEQGSFQGPATVSIRSGCGSINVKASPGDGWRLEGGNTAGHAPSLSSSARSLSIDSLGEERWRFLDGGRDTWNVTLPTSELAELSLALYAGRGQVDLSDARMDRLEVTANASEVVVDASGASVADVSAVVNVGFLSLHLPAEGDVAGSLRVGGGELQVCSPPGVGLRVTTTGGPQEVTVGGRHEGDSEWESPGYASATHHADLRVSSNFGAVKINPIGGCR